MNHVTHCHPLLLMVDDAPSFNFGKLSKEKLEQEKTIALESLSNPLIATRDSNVWNNISRLYFSQPNTYT